MEIDPVTDTVHAVDCVQKVSVKTTSTRSTYGELSLMHFKMNCSYQILND